MINLNTKQRLKMKRLAAMQNKPRVTNEDFDVIVMAVSIGDTLQECQRIMRTSYHNRNKGTTVAHFTVLEKVFRKCTDLA
tara:strand:- start:50 stop:289 length:240 start_codon:yes stop_codon:yes gene_type:complete